MINGMLHLGSVRFLDISNINFQDFLECYLISKGMDFFFKKINLQLKLKPTYYIIRGFKYQILFNYENWKISRKHAGSKFNNHRMSKIEKHYFCQMLISKMMVNPNHVNENENEMVGFLVLLHTTYPEIFRKFFGETKAEFRARLNIEKFFLNVFA